MIVLQYKCTYQLHYTNNCYRENINLPKLIKFLSVVENVHLSTNLYFVNQNICPKYFPISKLFLLYSFLYKISSRISPVYTLTYPDFLLNIICIKIRIKNETQSKSIHDIQFRFSFCRIDQN